MPTLYQALSFESHKRLEKTVSKSPGNSEGPAFTKLTVSKSPEISEGPASTTSTSSEIFFSLGFFSFKCFLDLNYI